MSITIPELDPIEFLVLRKFPDAEAIQTAFNRMPIPGSLSSEIYITRYKNNEVTKLHEEIVAYRKELEAKPSHELQTFYSTELKKQNEEFRLKADKEEQKRFWNHPSANADFSHWGKATYWTLEEAIALSFGKEPKTVNWEKLKHFTFYPPSPFIEQYSKTRDLVLRAKGWNQVYDPARPSYFIAWAKRTDIPFPVELEKEVVLRDGNIGDWKDAYDKLFIEYKKLGEKSVEEYKASGERYLAELQKKSDEIIDLIRQKRVLLDKITELERTPSVPKEKPLKTRERDTLLKLVIGMAAAWYGYDPKASKNSAITDIESDLHRIGITVSDDTIRKKLNEAAEFLPQETEKA